MYAVITCDIIDSKKTVVDLELKKKVERINKSYLNDFFVTDFNISRGDEIQGVIIFNEQFFKIMRLLRIELKPYKLRVAVAIGEESINNGIKNSWNLNGKLFHEARELLDNISKVKKSITRFSIEYSFLSAYYDLVNMIMDKWTEKASEAVYEMDKIDNISLIAPKFDITPQSVRDRLNSAEYYRLKESEEKLTEYMKKLGVY